MPGIGQELLYMIIMGVVYQIVLLLLEYGIIQKIIARIFKTDDSVFQASINDEDVQKESQRVSQMISTGTTKLSIALFVW